MSSRATPVDARPNRINSVNPLSPYPAVVRGQANNQEVEQETT
jgi:hypothetical protein